MKRPVSILITLLAAVGAAACDGETDLATPAAPYIRLPAAPGRPGAGYFDLVVPQDQGALVSVASPRIGRIEMHETMTSGSMSSMRPIRRAAIDEGGRIRFVPGGRHLMLFDVDRSLRPGDEVMLTFNFERGAPRTFAARVETAGGAAH